MGLLNAVGGLFQSDQDRKLGNLNALQRFGIALGQEGTGSQDIPAAMQLTNEFLRAQQSGDLERANALQMFAKTLDKGVILSPQGQAVPLAGYPQALGQIAGVKSEAEQQGKKNVDLTMDPKIARTTEAAKVAGLQEGKNAVKTIQAPNTLGVLDQIEKLLPKATSGGLNTNMRDLAAYFNYPTESSKIDTQIAPLASVILANVPRFEGPQSDRDVAEYKKAAGDLANSNIPAEARLSALQSLRSLNQKYVEQGNPAPAAPAPSPSSSSPMEGKTATNPQTGERLIFKEGKWRPLQ